MRTQGDKEPLHVWQLVHDAKEAVRKMSKATIEAMLTYAGGMYTVNKVLIHFLGQLKAEIHPLVVAFATEFIIL